MRCGSIYHRRQGESKEVNEEQTLDRSVSKVEVTGFEARHYDLMMNVITGGTYPFFIRRAVRDMHIQTQDHILILGSGTGRNACLMHRYLSAEGRIVGLDIGEEMLKQARWRCRGESNVSFEKQRADVTLPYQGEFDKVFISFVLHGFVQEDRLRIVHNAYQALKPGGAFQILDYAHFDPERSGWLIRMIFGRLECPLAADFARRDWQAILRAQDFDRFEAQHYYFDYVQLLSAYKTV